MVLAGGRGLAPPGRLSASVFAMSIRSKHKRRLSHLANGADLPLSDLSNDDRRLLDDDRGFFFEDPYERDRPVKSSPDPLPRDLRQSTYVPDVRKLSNFDRRRDSAGNIRRRQKNALTERPRRSGERDYRSAKDWTLHPRQTMICLRRKVRKEVMLALGLRKRKKGRGSGAPRDRWNDDSKVKCRR